MSAIRMRLGVHEPAVHAALGTLVRGGLGRRLLAHDDRIWGDDPAHRKVAANRLGWLDAPGAMRADAESLAAFAREVAAEGFTHAVLLGMGGSSLAPEVFRHTFGVARGGLELSILDNTSPAAVEHIARTHDLTRTLFIVASKSGGTIEVVSFERTFWERVQAARPDPGRAFIAITDPGTSLGALAASRGYRRTFINPADIGGRYSSLSRFGLVPAALLGVDVAALLDSAIAERAALQTDSSAGIELGAALGALARAGRDKLTLVLAPALASYGTWIEQLVAESTGKSGVGILPVAEEPLATPDRYGVDRVFVAIGAPDLPAPLAASLDALAAAGHPVIAWSLPRLLDLGGDMLRWEIATATAAAVLAVDPFDEPDVSAAKAATQRVLDRARAAGQFEDRPAAASADGLRAFVPDPAATPVGSGPDAWLETLRGWLRPGDYVALLAYVHRTDARHAALQRLRLTLRDGERVATTLGYGPRFLHSTGQLHKGGPATGVFLQLTADEGEVAIPGESYGFATLRAAQAAGDFEVLVERGRRVLRVHLGADVDAGLDRLTRGLEALRS